MNSNFGYLVLLLKGNPKMHLHPTFFHCYYLGIPGIIKGLILQRINQLFMSQMKCFYNLLLGAQKRHWHKWNWQENNQVHKAGVESGSIVELYGMQMLYQVSFSKISKIPDSTEIQTSSKAWLLDFLCRCK